MEWELVHICLLARMSWGLGDEEWASGTCQCERLYESQAC